MDAAVLEGLSAKYREMRSLRLLDLNGGSEDPRPRMRALAARFPGALREIDELPLELISQRIVQLDEALAGGAIPGWARTLGAYHAWMRVALALKRRFGRTRDAEAACAWIAATYERAPGGPEPTELDGPTIEAILRPPGGRLTVWVLERIAGEEARSASELEREAFPESPSCRARDERS